MEKIGRQFCNESAKRRGWGWGEGGGVGGGLYKQKVCEFCESAAYSDTLPHSAGTRALFVVSNKTGQRETCHKLTLGSI